MFCFHLSLSNWGQGLLPHPSMGTVGAHQTGTCHRMLPLVLLNVWKVEKDSSLNLTMWQVLNRELASLLHGHSKVSVERRVDTLLPGQTWMESNAETQG